MKTVTISIELNDILRECIDNAALYKRNFSVSDELLNLFLSGQTISDEDRDKIDKFLMSIALEIFLGAKESLIIPDDAAHKAAEKILKSYDFSEIRFAYQDFYAYQFVDKLQDIVRRALKIREVFSKYKIP